MSTSTTERTVKFGNVPVKLRNGSKSTLGIDPTYWGVIDGVPTEASAVPAKDDAVAIALQDLRVQVAKPSLLKRIGERTAAILEAMAVIRPPFSAVHGPYTQIQVDLYREDLARRRDQAEMLRAR